jgi:UPF0755 protein
MSKDQEQFELEDRQKEASIVRRIVLIIFTIILLSLTAAIGGGYMYIKSAIEPVNTEDTRKRKITIPIGSSVTTIANILKENELIVNPKIFKYYVKYKNETGFQAGNYELSPSMTIEEIIASLKTGKVIRESLFSITIPEGQQLTQIAEILATKTEYTPEEVLKKLNDETYVKELITLYPTVLSEDILNDKIKRPLEGYLFPATYPFYEENPSIEKIVQTMLDKTESVLTHYQSAISESRFNVHEVMTLASLIEEEATAQVDREKIASVFLNRLNINMPLQTDPSVLYSLGKHQVGISYDDLKTDSPYNTYLYPGLTPGPIANAGEVSIYAVLNPAETNSLYFYARPNGEVHFTETLKEHNRVKAKFKSEWNEYKKNN